MHSDRQDNSPSFLTKEMKQTAHNFIAYAHQD